jgi:quinol monooxygenase YgiN
MIMFTLRLVAPSAQRQALLKSLSALLGPTRVQPGCLGCHLYTAYDEPHAIVWLEEWVSQAALDRHLGSDAHKTLVAAMELSSAAPEVRFDTVVRTAGLEVIARAQGSADL